MPKNADTRDTENKRLCTGFMKLLFPHVRRSEDVNVEEFNQYCLDQQSNAVLRLSLVLLMRVQGKDIPDIKLSSPRIDVNENCDMPFVRYKIRKGSYCS